MITIARIILVLFVVFLSTPTIVTLIKSNTDVSMFYSLNEEEESGKEVKDFKEIKADFKLTFDYKLVSLYNNTSSRIVSENLSKHDDFLEEIYSPPPEVI